MAEPEWGHSVAAYCRLVRNHPAWRILWIGEILSSLGNWFAYIATLLVVEKLAGGRGILLSVVLIMRFLPSLFVFPVAGVFADRYDRANILIYSCLISAFAAAALPIVQRPQQLWLLYSLLFVEFSTQAFYDPARRALTPSLVPRNLLHLATTIDSFAWSLTGAVGASLGGLAASRLSVHACFFLDAATYLVAAACNVRLKMLVAQSTQGGAAAEKEAPDAAERGVVLPATATVSTVGSQAKATVDSTGAIELQDRDFELPAARGSKSFLGGGLSSRQGAEEGGSPEEEESSALLGGAKQLVGGQPKAPEGSATRPPEGCLELISSSIREEVASMKEGWTYVWNPFNRDVLALTVLKAAGSLIWGAADVLNVRFSELPEMQGLGDAAFTLGLFFASVGVACLIGPIIFNIFTPPKPPHLLLSAAFCFLFLLSGYIGMAVAHNVYQMCLSIILKSFGSAVLWVYSTLLLQIRVPDGLLGRTMALEMAFFTVAESASGLFGGFALDNLGMSIRLVSVVMAVTAAVVSCVWVPYAYSKYARAARSAAPSNQL